jgi:alkylation response protein AidB-like acyl-CoA dehydrogenase
VRFAFDEEQRMLQKSVRDLFDQRCSAAEVRAAWSRPDGRVPELWQRLAELGVLGIMVPTAHGGLGLGELDLVLVLEEAGRAALPEPLAGTAALGAPLLAEAGDERAAEWLPKVAAGVASFAVVLEPWPYVAHARAADLLLIERSGAIFAVVPDRASLVAQPSVDGSRRLERVEWEARDLDRIASGRVAREILERTRDRAALATSAELVGLAARLLDLSVTHAKTREQFGKPIGSFQAIKHHLAEGLLALSFARPLVYRAAYSLARGSSEQSLHASMAKAAAADAAHKVARIALQVHGAIGYSFEYDLHLYIKRVWSLSAAYGDALFHRERCARRVLDGQTTAEI